MPDASTAVVRSARLPDLHQVAAWITSARDAELWAGWRVSFPIDLARLPETVGFSDANSFCLLDDGTIVAFGQIIGKASRAHLARLIVKPSVRGKGYGRTLVQHLLARIRQESFDRVSLNVDASNAPAVSLYLALGFRDVPRPPDEPGPADTRYMERAVR